MCIRLKTACIVLWKNKYGKQKTASSDAVYIYIKTHARFVQMVTRTGFEPVHACVKGM